MHLEDDLYNLAMVYWELQTHNYDIERQYPELLVFDFSGPDLTGKLETLTAKCKEIQVKEKPLPEPDANLIFRDDIAPVPNNSVISVAARAIMSGGKDFPRKADGWQIRGDRLEYKDTFEKAGTIIITIDNPEPVEVVQRFNILTLDVFMAVLGQVSCTYCANRTSTPLSQVSTVTARHILRYKGVPSYGAKRWALIEKINREMMLLGQLKVEVQGAATCNGKENYKGSLVITESVKRDFNPVTKQYVVTSWRVRPGKWAVYDMSQDGYQFIGKLDHRVFQYDHREQRGAQTFAKKLMYALFAVPGGMYYLKNGAKKSFADYLKLIGEYHETDDVNRNTRRRNLKRLGEALDFLVDRKMITTNMVGSVAGYIKARSRPWHLQHTLETVVEIKKSDTLRPALPDANTCPT